MNIIYSFKHYVGQKCDFLTSKEELVYFYKAKKNYSIQDLYLFVDNEEKIFNVIVEALGLLHLPKIISPSLESTICNNNANLNKKMVKVLRDCIKELRSNNKKLKIPAAQYDIDYYTIIGGVSVSPVPSQVIRIFKLQENPITLTLLKEEETLYEEAIKRFGIYNNAKSLAADEVELQLRFESVLFKRSAYRQTSWIEALIGWYRKISIEEQKKAVDFIRKLKLTPLLINVQALEILEIRENEICKETFQDFVIAQTLSRIGIYLDENEKAALIAEFKGNDKCRRDFSFIEYLLAVLYSPKNDSKKLTEQVSWRVSLRDWVEAVLPLSENRTPFQRCCELKNNLFADADEAFQKSKTVHVLQIYLFMFTLEYLNEFKISENNKKCLFSYFYSLSEDKLNVISEIICHFEKNKNSGVLTSPREVEDGKHLFALFVWELSMKELLPAKYLEFLWDGVYVVFQEMSNKTVYEIFSKVALEMINEYSAKIEVYELPNFKNLDLSLKLKKIYKNQKRDLSSILSNWKPYFAKLQRFQFYVLKEIENALDVSIPQETLFTIMFFCPFAFFEKEENETDIIKKIRSISDIRKQLSKHRDYLYSPAMAEAEAVRGLFQSDQIISDGNPVLTKHLASMCAELYATLLPGLTFFKDICASLKSSVTEGVFKKKFVDHEDDPGINKMDHINISWETTNLSCKWNKRVEVYSQFEVILNRMKQNELCESKIEVPLEISYQDLNEFVWQLVDLQVEALETTECSGDLDDLETAYQSALKEVFTPIQERTLDLLIAYSKKKNPQLKPTKAAKEETHYRRDKNIVVLCENQNFVRYELNPKVCNDFDEWDFAIFRFLIKLKNKLREAQWSFFLNKCT